MTTKTKFGITIAELDRLNRKFGERFGYKPDPAGGESPRFRWQHSTETFLFERDGWYEMTVSDSTGLVASVPKFKRTCAAEFHGPCWLIGSWQPPTDGRGGDHVAGGVFMGSSKGDYAVAFSMDLDVPPDEKITDRVIHAITRQIGIPDCDLRQSCEDMARKPYLDACKEFDDEFDDQCNPAFGNMPALVSERVGTSRGGNTSFGGV